MFMTSCFHTRIEKCSYEKMVGLLPEIGFWQAARINVTIKNVKCFHDS